MGSPTGSTAGGAGHHGRLLAAEAFRRYLASPGEALELATSALAAARAEGDLLGESKSECVLGLVAVQLSDLTIAGRHLRRAVRLGVRAGDPPTVAEAQVHLAFVLVHRGRGPAALALLGSARPFVTESTEPWWYVVHALVLKGLGRWEESLGQYGLALKSFERSGDLIGRGRVLINRGVALAYRGRFDAAEADLLAADRLLEGMEQPLTRAIAVQDLGWVAGQRGDIPRALRQYDRAVDLYSEHRRPPPSLFLDRCELLLSAGLVAEARVAAAAAVAEATQAGHTAELSEARLRLAEAALAAGDAATTVANAEAAAREFARQRRHAWAAVARWLVIQAMLADGRPVTSARVRQVARRLEAAGWVSYALDGRMRAAELALAEGRRASAEEDLRHAARHRRSGPVGYRQLSWQATARLRLLHGDHTGARRAAERGLRIVEEHQDSLGATDLRALASRRLATLAELGLRSALATGRPAAVLRWADRSRAAHLRRPPVFPPDDGPLADQLGHLRQIVTQRVRSVEAGQPYRPDLVRQQVAVERSIRDRRRHLPGASGHAIGTVDVPALAAALGPAVLVEYVAVDGRLHALTCALGRVRRYELGGLPEVERLLAFMTFTLRRLAAGFGREPGSRALDTLLRDGVLLDRLLLHPLRAAAGDGPLVVVPTAGMQGVPWSLLPSCTGRPVSVAPSATLWYAARTATTPPRTGTVLIGGPDLPHARDEIAALGGIHPGARVLTGATAEVDAVLSALDGADLAHVAAHGDFRADNPQFSALRLADGPLTVYDLERLRRAPRRLVLSACDSARTGVFAGDEVLGLAPTVLSLGAEAMVASVVLVPDAETRPMMIDLHGRLRAGESLASALAAAQSRTQDDGDPRSVAAASAFVCIGAG
jgi:tetratricopeptide (TPR) repeat protein